MALSILTDKNYFFKNRGLSDQIVLLTLRRNKVKTPAKWMSHIPTKLGGLPTNLMLYVPAVRSRLACSKSQEER